MSFEQAPDTGNRVGGRGFGHEPAERIGSLAKHEVVRSGVGLLVEDAPERVAILHVEVRDADQRRVGPLVGKGDAQVGSAQGNHDVRGHGSVVDDRSGTTAPVDGAQLGMGDKLLVLA